jgi:peroxiredoxin
LNESFSEFEKRSVKLITIATDRERPLKKLAMNESYKFSVIADSDAKLSNEYNVFGRPVDFEMIGNELAIPSTYLINPKGEIVWRYIGTKTDRPTIDAIISAIEKKL